MASWGLPREFQEVALLRAQESDTVEVPDDSDDVEDDGKKTLLTLVRSGRQIARVLTGSWDFDDARWRGGFLSLSHLCEDLDMEYDALLSLCDAVVPSWNEWSATIALAPESFSW